MAKKANKKTPNLIKIISGNWKFIAFLILIVVAIYANTIDNQLTLVDDMQAFVFNNQIQDLTASLKSLSIQRIVYSISYQFFQHNPMPIRIVAIFLHTVITVLVFLFVYLVWDKKTAKIASLIFAVHSVNTEAATWISGAPYLYFGLFNFIIFILYTMFYKSKERKFLYIAVVVYILEMFVMKSPWVLVPPMALLVLDQMILRKKFNISKTWWIILFAIPVTIYLLIYFEDAYMRRVEARSGGGNRVTLHTQAFTPVLEGYPYTTSLMTRLYLFPKNLSVYYDGMEVTTSLYIFMYVGFALYIAATVYFYFKKRQVSGILMMIPVLIAPAYSPIKITWFLAERYLYSGTAFVGVLAAMGAFWLRKKVDKDYIVYGLVGLIVAALAVRTVIRNEDWQDTETLSYANMKSSPLSVRPYNDMGGHYYYQGDYETAIYWYEKALTVVPTSGTAINNLGFLYFELGPLVFWEDYQPEPNPEKAQELFEQGNKIKEGGGDPRTISYFYNKALAYDRDNVEIILTAADMYEKMGYIEHALSLYSYALDSNPDDETIELILRKFTQLSNQNQ